ncbi:PREDICTED: olfactomedin-4 [Condylura cristata]|uniref:olfactomedin-4 n=1 Tax=Condylura cristata TaxID=143302 RepID=UPI0003343322|nr:PREDICTED: olfactomedin-4 [Condylura cristata]
MWPVLATVLLLPLVFPGQTQNLEENPASSSVNCSQIQPVYELVRSVPGPGNEDGMCHCVVHLPDGLISVQQLEQLWSKAQVLMDRYERALSRVGGNACAVEGHDQQDLEGNSTLESMHPNILTSSYETSVFNLLHQELEGAQELITQLKAKGGDSGADGLLHQLQSQVANTSFTFKLLADSVQSTLRVLHQEVDVLEGQLSQCEREKEQEESSPHPGLSLPPGSCAHGGLQKVSRPLVVQLNWRGFSYKAGAWGRDSAPNSDSSLYWVAPLRADGRYFDYYRLYKSYDDLVLLKNSQEWKMGYGDGSGNTVYKNFMYFNYYGTADMAKVDLSSNTLVLRRPLPAATYNNRFSYAGVPWKDLDFAGDEKGLWVLYATEESKGNLVVSRLNASSLEVEKTWHTSQYKPALSGAFMACGVLYALRSLSTRQEEIFYAFDTATGQEHHISVLLDKMLETLQGINYCPSDRRLYVFNDGYLMNYDLSFLTLKPKQPRPPAKRSSGAGDPPKPIKPNKISGP